MGHGPKHEHRAGGRETAIPAIAIHYGYLNERDDQLQESAGAPILLSKCDRDRWIGAAIVPSEGAIEYVIAELKNDVSGSGLNESTATPLKLAGVTVKIEESALYDSQSNGLAEGAVKDVKDAVRTNLPGGHPALACEILCCDGEQMQERSRCMSCARGASSRERCRILHRRSCSRSLGSRESSLVCPTGVMSQLSWP